jgi:carbamoyl-phosphate synthase small subunit
MTDERQWHDPAPTALLALADGTIIEGHGIGAEGQCVGEVVFNTAMTGYQEILTDPSYAGQIVTSPSRTSATSASTMRTSRR